MNKIKKEKAPKNYSTYHHQECGTKYRGCSPKCPADIYEQTGKWTGQKDMEERLKHLNEEIKEIEEEILHDMQIEKEILNISRPNSPKCAVCGSRENVDYHNVGNVGIFQFIPLCESCKPNKKIQ